MRRHGLCVRIVVASLIFLMPLTTEAKEVFVTLHEECFYLSVDEKATLEDVTKKIKAFANPEMNTVLIELPLKEDQWIEPVRWKLKAKRHGQNLGFSRDYFAQLHPSEHNDIRFIITFLANKSLISIAGHRGALEEAGDRIDHIHPLRFLLTVFSDEELKVGIRNIRGKGWVWGDFVSGIKESLSTEMYNQNMTDAHVLDFASRLGIKAHLITPAVKAGQWDDFIDILITEIPRKGDFRRYDS